MKHSRAHDSSRGFALILVLSLLALLVLMTYAVSSVSKVDGEISTAAVYQTRARQNAIVGLHVALGQLQQTAGALTSVTGTSAILSSSLAENSRWTGVWQNSSSSPVWLVSGGVSPSSFSAGFTWGTDGGDEPVVVPQSQENVVLVGHGSTNTKSSRYITGDAVLVPRVEVVTPLNISQPTGAVGHYAYWVGDEGVKISAQLPGENPPSSPSPTLFAINLMKYSWTPDTAKLPNVIMYEQLTEAGAGSTSIKNTFHHVTLLHMGFLDASTRRAGLINVNTASERVWRDIVESFDSGQSDTRTQNFANEILAGLGSGPYRTVAEFTSSPALEAAVGRLSGVSTTDFLAAMEPWFTVRSDTFRIRAYGDAMNPADANLTGATPESVAYCEAIVQRTNQEKFVITYFRWLGPDDI